MLWRLLELLFLMLFATGVITQLVIPLWTNQLLFPIFRRHAAEVEIAHAREQVIQDELAKEADTLRHPPQEPPDHA